MARTTSIQTEAIVSTRSRDGFLLESPRGRAALTAAFTDEVVAGADHLYAGRESTVAARIASWMRGL